MRGKFGLFVFGLIGLLAVEVTMSLAGCFQAAGQPFPTSQQIMDACAKGSKPDCDVHYAIQMACNAEALGPVVNPLITTVNPVAGSILTIQSGLNRQICADKGFYSPTK